MLGPTIGAGSHGLAASAPANGTKAPPGSAAVTAKRRSCAGMRRPARDRFAASTVVIPASRSSRGNRRCGVPKARSMRPRASGE